MNNIDSVLCLLSTNLRKYIGQAVMDYSALQEIRLRTDKALNIRYNNCFFNIDSISGQFTHDISNAVHISNNDIKETMEYVSNYSLYAFEDELRQGFITVFGGHRVGICGKVVMEADKVRTIKNIASINIRIAHEIINCSDNLMPYIYSGLDSINNTILVSPPCCGKTTLLRDIIRQLSNGGNGHKALNIGIVDERSELAACYAGVPNADIGTHSDVLDCCTKAAGMIMLIRAMSPDVIAIDEIGLKDDIEAIRYAAVCGCRLLCTIHALNMEDLLAKPHFNKLLTDKLFERYIFLSGKNGIGTVEAIYDKELRGL